MKMEARFWDAKNNNSLQCHLCPHNCLINSGKKGICGVRENQGGKLFSLIYGSCSAVHEDPIEKKPLYHFYPGTTVFSLGSVGCNFNCDHCQNFEISRAKPKEFSMNEIPPESAVDLAKKYSCRGIAWTYNEPIIWHEYSYDTAKLSKKAGLYTVYVTNGYINEEPLKEISKYLDAMNVDIKAFDEKFYKNICKAKLEPVLNTCEVAKELGIHIEITYLVIPRTNDSVNDITKFCKWVIDKLGKDVAVHFSRFHPDYKMRDLPPTPVEKLIEIYDIAKKTGILYPYIGNVPNGEYESTKCPSCGDLLVQRFGFSTQIIGLEKGRCKKCNQMISIVSDF